MAKIVLTYPESWLTVNVTVYEWDTVAFSGIADEVLTTKNYVYEFTEEQWVDYTYTATVEWYEQMWWAIFHNISWWLTPEQATQLEQASNVLTFADLIVAKNV